MNCKKIRDFIMTDYADSELNKSLDKQIRQHLDTCASCRQFENSLKQSAINPLRKRVEVKPPDYLWYRIKDKIESRKLKSIFISTFENICSVFSFRKPVLAVTTIVLVFLITVLYIQLPVNNGSDVSGYLGEQVEFLAYLDYDQVEGLNGNGLDFGTTIEEYFM